MLIVTSQANFGAQSGSGPQVTNITVDMGAPLTKATALLTGFRADYANQDDHHLGLLQVDVAVAPGAIVGQTVAVTVTYGLRDWSGDWDDAYEGQVFFTVVGE